MNFLIFLAISAYILVAGVSFRFFSAFFGKKLISITLSLFWLLVLGVLVIFTILDSPVESTRGKYNEEHDLGIDHAQTA